MSNVAGKQIAGDIKFFYVGTLKVEYAFHEPLQFEHWKLHQVQSYFLNLKGSLIYYSIL